ncbi:DUF5691 domain-containing protein [Lapillicoccus jejuensis]|uniref:SWIM zinc finger protein n=1 Tax=Lapillicoccus jejuensis TaxID=402171 RepID=A0A542E3L7_9MICO|nr:DUF5691 domain-containing protein [Lapillicoccus jejuensis]TQJ09917.1 SWIM zinc finger protein [Lapillicoccus jejuensis]
MTPWELEQVLALASDDAARTAARRTATPSMWSGTGASDRLLWGECVGSGTAPYRTVVDFGEGAGGGTVATTCTCPSRKLPCKHALALLLLWSTGSLAGGPGTVADPPPYAAAWLAARLGRAERAAAPDTPRAARGTSPATVARRAARVGAGLEELERWLADQVRTGVANASADAYHRFDPVAARMVDAQAPGVAATLRRLPQVVGTGGDWPGRLLQELAGLHLLARAHGRLDALPDGLAATVRSRVGYTVPTEAVLATEGVPDRWQVLAVEQTEQGGLVTRRTRLWGESTDRPALVLTFGAGGQAPDASLRPGTVVEGPAHFYPGDPPLRAVLADPVVVDRLDWVAASPRPRTVARLLDEAAAALAADPWTSAWPGLLEARPAGGPDGWALVDADGDSLAVLGPGGGAVAFWRRLLAVSGGAPVTAAVEVVDGAVLVLGAWPLVAPSGGSSGWGGAGGSDRSGGSDGSGPAASSAAAADAGDGGPRRSAAWRELVAAATVGAGSRPLPVGGFHPVVAVSAAGVERSDPATALLDLAALEARAVAAAPVTGRARPLPPAPPETAPVVAPRLVALVLEAVELDRGLAADLLQQAVAAGVVAPPETLVALVALAERGERGGGSLATLVARLGGARLRWLGQVDPSGAVGGDDGTPQGVESASPDGADGAHGRDGWDGVGPERERWLRATRAVDPDRARAALTRTWAQETPPDRALFLDVLATGLGPDDEALLERARDDRRREVRDVAARLLLRLAAQVARAGGSTGAGERAAARATPYVLLGTSGLRRRPVLRVGAPTDVAELEALAPGAVRDGLGAPPPAGWPGGPRAWLLHRLVLTTPLATWERLVGDGPDAVLALPREGDLAPVLDAAWVGAAVEQQDVAWARALLAVRPDAPARLVGVLPAAERAEPLVALLGLRVAQGRPVTPDLLEVLEPVPAPWPRALGASVRALAEAGLDGDGLLVALAARRVRLDDPDDEERWRAWARRLLATGSPRPGLRRALDRLGRVVALRTAFAQELGGAPAPRARDRTTGDERR